MNIFNLIWEQILKTSAIEWIIVVFGFAYLFLITKKNVLAWPCAIIGSSFTIYLCYNADYFLEMLLSAFYVVMGVWGWISWTQTSVKSEANNHKIRSWKLNYHLINIGASGLLTILVGYLFDQYTNQQLPYLDAFITVFSLVATFMVTQKILENWIYWVIIDIASVQLYAYRDYYLVAFQMLVYSIIAVYGYVQWRKDYRIQKTSVR